MILRDSGNVIAQCRANVEAWIEYYGFPRLKVNATLKDRVICDYSKEFVDAMDRSAMFSGWKWFVRRLHGPTAVWSRRDQNAMYAMQVTAHEKLDSQWQLLRDPVLSELEIDFDLFNPDRGAFPAIGHLAESLWPGKTDPYRIRAGLVRRGIEIPLIR